jgi:hypothetical protein
MSAQKNKKLRGTSNNSRRREQELHDQEEGNEYV